MGLSIHFQYDDEKKIKRNDDIEREKEKEKEKPIEKEVNNKNIFIYKFIKYLIIALTFEVISIILLLPIILMGR